MSRGDRIFTRDGRKHFRRSYSLVEVRIGLVVVLLLAAVLGWVVWKGAHPEPGLFDAAPPQAGEAPAGAESPLPEGLAPAGWSRGPVSSYDAENLYVKIDGRADYYIAFGFERLWFATLTSDEEPERAVDIELFDQGSAANALGAYEGERSPSAEPRMEGSGLWHLDRNALFLTSGRFYARVIAAEESEEVRELLLGLRERLAAGLPSEPLPWAYALFAGKLGLAPADVSYQPENAFSFGFARDVWSATLEDGETELFVVVRTDPAGAAELAGRFLEGFQQYGEPMGERWVRDRYLGTVAGAESSGEWVLGVRGAPGTKAAWDALGRLSLAVASLPEEVVERARAAAAEAAARVPGPVESDGYEEDSYGSGEGM
jgi:hypothetical protein